MPDITAFGLSFTVADLLYPDGLTIKEGSDDVPLISCDNPEFGKVNVGLNGHKISWVHSSVYTVTVAVIPNTDTDRKLKAMVAYNRPQVGGSANIDSIQGVLTEGVSGEKTVFADMTMTSGAITNVTTTEGRFETRTYTFSGTVVAY